MHRKLVIFIMILTVLLTGCSAFAPEPTATPVPTNTPALEVPEVEFETFVYEDGREGFFNHSEGYTIIFPEDWILLEAYDSETLTDSIIETMGEFPDLEEVANLSETVLQDGLHLFAYYLSEEDFNLDFISNANVIDVREESLFSLGMQDLLDINISSLPELIPGVEVMDSEILENKNGIEIGVIYLKMPGEIVGANEDLSQSIYFWFNNTGLTNLTFSAFESMETDSYLEDVANIVDSIELID